MAKRDYTSLLDDFMAQRKMLTEAVKLYQEDAGHELRETFRPFHESQATLRTIAYAARALADTRDALHGLEPPA